MGAEVGGVKEQAAPVISKAGEVVTGSERVVVIESYPVGWGVRRSIKAATGPLSVTEHQGAGGDVLTGAQAATSGQAPDNGDGKEQAAADVDRRRPGRPRVDTGSRT